MIAAIFVPALVICGLAILAGCAVAVAYAALRVIIVVLAALVRQ